MTVVFTPVAPPVGHAGEGDRLLPEEAIGFHVIRPGRRVEAVVVGLLVIRAEVLEELAGRRAQSAEELQLIGTFARGLHRQRMVVVFRDAAPLAGVVVGIPVVLGPRGAVEIEREEEVIDRDRLAVGELRVRVQAEIGRHAVRGHRPAGRESRDDLIGVGMSGEQSEIVVIVEFAAEAVVGVRADAPERRRSGHDELTEHAAAHRARVGEFRLSRAVLPDKVLGEVGRLGEAEEVRVLGVEGRGSGVLVGLGAGGADEAKEGEEESHRCWRRRSKASCNASPMELIMTMVPTRQPRVGPRIHQACQFSLAWWRRSPQEGSVGGRPKPR